MLAKATFLAGSHRNDQKDLVGCLAARMRDKKSRALKGRAGSDQALSPLRTPIHKCILKAQEVEDVADGRACTRVAIARVWLARDETVLEAEKIEDIQRAHTRRLIAVGITEFTQKNNVCHPVDPNG